MSKKLIRQAALDLSQAMCGREFLQRLSITKKAMTALMHDADWPTLLGQILPIQERLNCGKVASLVVDLLNRLSPEPEEGWLEFTFLFARNLMFPDAEFAARAKKHNDGARFLLQLLQVLFAYEKQALPFDCLYDFRFVPEEDLTGCDHAQDYRRLLKIFREEYVYELLRIAREVTPFCLMEHVVGVHHVAMTVAYGLHEAGIPVDLALVSGAAAGHDLGKFGCKPGERVPYLHYYYTDRWFLAHDIPTIGHIAANHSTWDLEIENLSAESLALIYADFRVKQSRDSEGREITTIYDLDASFQVILDKLDNVDEAKRRRYRFVYDKLHDFENYLRQLGVDFDLAGRPLSPPPQKNVSLMDADETIDKLVLLSVEHNLGLMHNLSSNRQFGNILEAARSEKNWERLRAYLDIFEEYSTYLSPHQKTQALSFLYELLMHREGDIRRQAAGLMGMIIAQFRMGYRKELPKDAVIDPTEQTPFSLWEKYLEMLIFPDHKITAQQKSRIGYTVKIIVGSALDTCREDDAPVFLGRFTRYYNNPERYDDGSAFALLDTMLYLPHTLCSPELIERLIAFAGYFLKLDGEIRLASAAMRFLTQLASALDREHPCIGMLGEMISGLDCQQNIPMLFLQYKALQSLGLGTSMQEEVLYSQDVFSDIYLDNLKAATPWIIKSINIEVLLDQLTHGQREHILHIATHLSNLIKVSEWVVVRHDAGSALLRVMPLLSLDQRNEIAVELAKGLEVGEYEFSKYIPNYLGELALYLHPKELDELIVRLEELLGSSNDWIVAVSLNTLGVLLEHYPVYQERFVQSEHTFEARRQHLLGLLLDGLANYRESVRQEALLVIGKSIFGTSNLSPEEKTNLFSHCYKKLVFLITENPGGGLAFFYRAAALSHIYRFIALHRIDYGSFHFEQRQKVAFFPGTFDPFTLSHKGIVRAIRDLGFEVYLAIDEFSWSKKTQPHLIRRQIVSMSVADELHVQLFPDDVPVNIANPADLRRLRGMFPSKELYIVVGSDVVRNASSYRAAPSADSIHSMNHIVFRRISGEEGDEGEHDRAALSLITGKVVELTLPPHLEDISSTRIRENIDLNRDISNLIDPAVQEFIYQNSLYLREPQYKPVIHTDEILFQREDEPQPELLAELERSVLADRAGVEHICQSISENGDTLILLRHLGKRRQIIGYASLRQITSSDLFFALHRDDYADYVRRRASGKILLLTGIYTQITETAYDLPQLLLTEALATSLAEGCTYAVFSSYGSGSPSFIHEMLERQGFVCAPCSDKAPSPLYVVDMRAPLVLIQNLETTIKEPFRSNRRVLDAIKAAHYRLQLATTQIQPGSLVLSLSADMIHHRMVDKITALNGVSNTQTFPRRLGKNMCVPFGKILRGTVVPNTVTKTLHTDKVYTPDIIDNCIEAFPYYSPIESQVRTIKSFNRPVILVDSLLHEGYRVQALDPLFIKEDIRIRMLMVGVLSGRGRDLMAMRNRPVDCIYYVPNLKYWFVESTLYPFIGGDTVRRENMPVAGLLPSVNRILPYSTPFFVSDCSHLAAFEFSRCCIENSRDILMVLESEYREQFGRNLTLNRLSEAVILPLCPDKGACMAYDPNLSASVYLENDLEMLMRTRKLMI